MRILVIGAGVIGSKPCLMQTAYEIHKNETV